MCDDPMRRAERRCRRIGIVGLCAVLLALIVTMALSALGLGLRTPVLAVLLLATLAVACVVSLSGLISFVGLLAPHAARLLTGRSSAAMLLSGLLGGALLCGADILARSVAATELPVSIFTSLLGAPFLLYLIIRGRQA